MGRIFKVGRFGFLFGVGHFGALFSGWVALVLRGAKVLGNSVFSQTGVRCCGHFGFCLLAINLIQTRATRARAMRELLVAKQHI